MFFQVKSKDFSFSQYKIVPAENKRQFDLDFEIWIVIWWHNV